MLYEYVITFDSEVNLVWKRRWSMSSLLLLTIRWFMVATVITSLLPSTPQVMFIAFELTLCD